MRLQLVTPLGVVVDEDVEMVTVSGSEGQMGIFPGHVPLVTPVVPSEVIIQQKGQERFFAIGEGMAEITGDAIAILTDEAIAAEDLDEHQLQQELQRTEEALKQKSSAEEIAQLTGHLARVISQTNAIRLQRKTAS